MATRRIFTLAILVLGVAFLFGTNAQASVVTFEGLNNGEVVTTQIPGVTIITDNFNPNHPDKAIIFDSTLNGTADPDLEDSWSGGNLVGEVLGNLLIIAENDFDGDDADPYVDSPDDEGRRPAGTIEFAFDKVIDSFGFDFVDVDNDGNGREDPSDYMVSFYLNNQLLDVMDFADYELLDGTIVHNNNYANIYPSITSADVGGDFNRVVVQFGGSGAIDNIRYSVVPEPATLLLFSSGMVGAFMKRRKRN